MTALPGEHVHEKPRDVGQEVALHHWMALLALEANDVPEAIHHVQHIIGLVTGEHLSNMQRVLSEMEEGNVHSGGHTIEGMLAGTASTGLTDEEMHLQLTLSAVRVDDAVNAVHHLDHFLDRATGQRQESGEAALSLLQADRIHDAEHELERLLGGVIGEEEHADADDHEHEAEPGDADEQDHEHADAEEHEPGDEHDPEEGAEDHHDGDGEETR